VIAVVAECALVALTAHAMGTPWAREGVCRLPAWRPWAVRAAFGVLLFTAGAAIQEHVAGGAAHSHASTGDHGRFEYPDVASSEPGQREAARRLLERVHRSARQLFPTYDAARRSAYVPSRGRRRLRPLAFHVRHAGHLRDGRQLNARRPEALVYWWPREGRPVLVGMMFRAPTARTPRSGNRMVVWHRHASPATGRMGSTAMTHVWLTDDLLAAFANCLPVDALERAVSGFRYSESPSAQALQALPCTSSPSTPRRVPPG